MKRRRVCVRVLLVVCLILVVAQGAPNTSQAQPAPTAEIERLLRALQDANPDARRNAAFALAQIGPAASAAVPALTQALQDERSDVRRVSAYALGRIGLRAVPVLTEALRDAHADLRRAAADALGGIGPAASAAVPALTEALRDTEPEVRRNAAFALGRIGPAGAVVPALTEALRDADHGVRWAAAVALGEIGSAAGTAVPALTEALRDANAEVRRNAAGALGRIGPAAGKAVTALTEALRDTDPEVRRNAANALIGFRPAADTVVPALIEALRDADATVRKNAAFALSQIGPAASAAVPALIEALRDADPDVRWSAVIALGEIGSAAGAAVPALIEMLRDASAQVRWSAIFSLGRIGPAAGAAVPALIDALRDADTADTMFRIDAANAAADAIAQIGLAAATAVPTLTEALGDANATVRTSAADALARLADELGAAGETAAISMLAVARDTLQSHADREVRVRASTVAYAVERLERRLWWQQLPREAWRYATANSWWVVPAGLYVLWGLSCLLLYAVWPRAVLQLAQGIDKLELPVPGKWTVNPRRLARQVFLGPLPLRPRVLDGWVAVHLSTARERFERKATVSERAIHIPVPVVLDGKTVPDLTGPTLRAYFARAGCLLVRGEGGSGKTSLACRIARWAMAEDAADRPCAHAMLPVLIEHELDITLPEGRDAFREAVRRELENLIDAPEPVAPGLLEALLRRRRVLVILDHLSEMTEATRQRVRPDAPDFPAAALVVTSRLDQPLGGVHRTVIQPLRVAGNRLSSFLDAYLRQRGVRDRFDDKQFFEACRRISVMVGDRDATVLLVKLYAEQLIEALSGEARDLPETIPDLMLSYLNTVNRTVPDAEHRADEEVHGDAKAVAWACLKDNHRPGRARMAEVLALLGGGDDARHRVRYLEQRLQLVEICEPGDRVRFRLDPLAEYLSGLYLVARFGAKEAEWRGFLADAAAKRGPPEATRGFLLAVHDCCLAAHPASGIPGFVATGLAESAHGRTDPAAAKAVPALTGALADPAGVRDPAPVV